VAPGKEAEFIAAQTNLTLLVLFLLIA